jgi:hypothetical protein
MAIPRILLPALHLVSILAPYYRVAMGKFQMRRVQAKVKFVDGIQQRRNEEKGVKEAT